MEEKYYPLAMTDTFFMSDNKRNRCAQILVMTNQEINKSETVPSKMAFKERPPDLEFEAGSGDFGRYGRLI
jgi:hypothetical protein